MFSERPSESPTWAKRSEDESLTYCLALRLHEGMLFLADTRTNAGVDDVGTYRKLREVWERHLLEGIAELPTITQDDLTEVDDPT